MKYFNCVSDFRSQNSILLILNKLNLVYPYKKVLGHVICYLKNRVSFRSLVEYIPEVSYVSRSMVVYVYLKVKHVRVYVANLKVK
jgi:hypothetical protein